MRIAEVEWIVAAGNYVEIHVDNQVHKVREKIGDFEQRLPPANLPAGASLDYREH